jgi:hypothetical protein
MRKIFNAKMYNKTILPALDWMQLGISEQLLEEKKSSFTII